MRVAVYVHPFDLVALRDRGGLARLSDLGIAEVAIATSYHDGRWLTPWHPERRVRFLEDGTVHFRPGRLHDYGVLQPLPSSHVLPDGPSPLEQLCREAPAAGMQVRAWTVFGHNTRLGSLHPDCCVENAWGDRYPYALCPAGSAVQDYHTALVQDLAAHEGLSTIEFEALGQMGINHSSHHDKKSFTPKGLLEFALSACFCPACLAVHAQLGVDGEAMRASVCAFLTEQLTDADAMAPMPAPAEPDQLDDEQRRWVAAVLAGRRHTVERLAAAVVPASGSCARAVQVHPDEWFTGSQLAAVSAAVFPAKDERVWTCYGDGPDGIAATLAAGARLVEGSPQRLCIWPKAPQFGSDEHVVHVRELCAEHGIGSVAIYHLGLLPWRTIERVARLLAV